MPTYARCPECHAALPTGAAWCSLCHADLRPAPEPVLVPTAGEAAADSTESTEPGRPRHAAPDTEVSATALPPVRGRHRRAEPDMDHAGPDTAAGAPDPVRLRADVDALVADAPRDADGRPDVEVLTQQLMARLATSEQRHRSGLPDVDSLPGGKWGVMVGGMIALAVLLVVVFGVLGAVVLG